MMKKSSRNLDEEIENVNPNIPIRENQIQSSILKPGDSDRNEDNMNQNQLVESRDGLLKRAKLPIYNGDDAY